MSIQFECCSRQGNAVVIIACMAVGFTTRAISAMSFESACCTRRGIQHVVIKFVSELWQVLCG
jgi:hypothetical protein